MSWELRSSRADYESYCTIAGNIPLCCFPWYLDAVCEGGEWGALTLFLAGEPVAAWPFFRKKRLWLKYVTMPHFTKYMGILYHEKLRPDQHSIALEYLTKAMRKMHGLDQQCSTHAEALLDKLPQRYRLTAHYTHQIALADGQDWRRLINRNMRRNIKKAEQQLTLRLDCDLQTFHRISALSFERQGLPLPYSYAALLKHDQSLVSRNRRQIFAAEDAEGRIHSVAYLMWSDEVAYYHLSGDDPELRRSGSGIWLIAQALDFAQSIGIQTFDFEGSMIPAIAAIREQFGAKRHAYSRIQLSNSYLYTVLKWWRQS